MVKWLKAPRFSFFRIFASSHLRIFSLCFSCLHGYFFHHKGLEVHFLRQLKRCHYGSTQPKCCVYHCSFLYMAGRPSPACNCSKVCHLLYPGRCHWAILNCLFRANPRIFVSSLPRVFLRPTSSSSSFELPRFYIKKHLPEGDCLLCGFKHG